MGQLIYVKIYSHHLNNYELGIYFYLMTISYFLNALVFVPVDYYQQSRIYPFQEADISLRTFLRFNRTLLLGIGGVTVLLMLPCLFVGRIVALDVLLCAAMSVLLYVTGAFKNLLNNLNHKLVVAALFLIEVVLKAILFYLAMWLLPARAIVLLASNIVALLIVLPLLILVSHRRRIFSSGSIHTLDYREVTRFSYPLSIGALANWMQSQGYRLVLVPLGYTEMVGVYATVANIGATAMSAVSVIYGQLYSPKLYQSHGSSLKVYLRGAFLMIVVVLAVSALFSDRLIPLLTRHDLSRYSRLMLYGIGTEAGNFLVGGLAIYMTIKNKTRDIMKGSFLGVAVVAVCIAVLCASGAANVYTIGLPIILAQASVVVYMLIIWRKQLDA
ncbi:MAG: hypothetical protein ACRYFS_02770 [Janthinobacterium lividum]